MAEHAADCKCTYCDAESQKKYQEILVGTKATHDGLNKTKPDVYKSPNQTEEDVKKTLNAAQKEQREHEKKIIKSYLEIQAHDPRLTYDDELKEDCSMPNLKYEKAVKDRCVVKDNIGIWRKLSGFDSVEISDKEFANEIIVKMQKEFPNLQIDWSDDCFNECLTINGARTNIKIDELNFTFISLKTITSEDEVKQIIYGIIIKKVKTLFI